MGDLQCWCRRCEQAAQGTPPTDARELMQWVFKHPQRFIVCPECGSKRCPRATAHWLACTDSNEPGQPGSDYGPEPAGATPPT